MSQTTEGSNENKSTTGDADNSVIIDPDHDGTVLRSKRVTLFPVNNQPVLIGNMSWKFKKI